MKANISMLMDGELGEREFDEALAALGRGDEARRAWCTYHLIRDALHGEDVLAIDLADGVAARLAQEPVVLAPRRITQIVERRRWMALSAAASFTAVALVGWLALAPHPAPEAGPVAAATINTPQTPAVPAAPAKVQVAVRVPLPSATDDFLLAHQGYSPRLKLQGVAPYIRTVSDEAVESDTR
ncbi:MAG: sigma-E factor negative regulatory protein [Burkholderiales bacterium]